MHVTTRRDCRRQWIAAALVLFILVQFVASMASAGAQQPECDEGEIFDPRMNECVEIEEEPTIPVATGEPMPTEEPTDEPTEVPTEDPTEEPMEDPTAEPTISTQPELSELYVYKWTCPEGFDVTDPMADFAGECVTPTDGVTFKLFTPDSQTLQTDTGDSVPGAVYFGGIEAGIYEITEVVPAGTEAIGVFGCPVLGSGENVFPTLGAGEIAIDTEVAPGQTVVCNWYNVPMMDDATPVAEEDPGYADLIIYKWECPAGYDPLAQGAFPMVDCTTPLNGVTFTLEGSGDFPLQTETGDAIDGAVMFGSQETGDWVITETLPDGYESAFVYECNGITDDSVHPTPLQMGNVLELSPSDGDSITCNWFNIPESDDDHGSLTVYKYICDGEAFVSELDCELYEGGVEIRVDVKDPQTGDWNELYVATTDEYGRVSFPELWPGSYGVEEVGGTPCHIEISSYDEDKNIAVIEGEETVVKLYNCGWEEHEPNKDPQEWPNTGAFQAESDCPVLSEPNVAGEATPETVEDAGCARGLNPVAIEIDEIEVDAEIETLETVNGTMQAPTGPEVVSWYKETARLGESGNVVLAGHLNYWGVPEGVFYDLSELEEGDVITLWDVDGAAWNYEVTSVENVPNDASPSEVLAPVDGEETLTLITCGGEWDSSESEYNERTIVKAERIPAGED